MTITTSIKEQVEEAFSYLHENPEISWEEVNTTQFIREILEENDCETITFDDCTGVIGKYGDFDKGLPIVAVRADMDALWQEVDGSFRANHSCGHDAHMAMVLGVLWRLQNEPHLKEQIAVKFIFQPAEEKVAGALKFVEKGVTEDVDYLFGIHLRPEQETRTGHATPAIVHGATKMYQAKITGHDAHGARPHQNINAIEVAAQIIAMIQQIHLDPRIPHSVKMTQLQSGGKNVNIIPGNATFSLDLRAQTNELMDELTARVEGILDSIKNLNGANIQITNTCGVVAAENHQEAIDIMQQSIADVLGPENVDPPLLTPGGDDFHYYSVNNPNLKATMVGLGCGLGPGLHHPKMTFNQEALINGADILYRSILNAYNID
ncbi:M20 peptidase aminoacylase family protein [Edaphobacillus lindanitolerans]|uniref:Amidohydrolase n=1 Tax=Edaphobacillus lindanitolerans TaxID=550447 RepID=A0A1U7PMT9_9BACI|nr:M20 peptidase aminoacylase family protein [Edaphobacillus lindanitolerans]SIT72660.1 amidohydrolase [Edaphobacillus lindanitolerans]